MARTPMVTELIREDLPDGRYDDADERSDQGVECLITAMSTMILPALSISLYETVRVIPPSTDFALKLCLLRRTASCAE